jgi:hypothetical protein
MAFAAVVAIVLAPIQPTPSRRIAMTQDVYRALLDSFYTTQNERGSPRFRDLMILDHFAPMDTTMMSDFLELLRDSVPGLPHDAIEDFERVVSDTSAALVGVLRKGAAADTALVPTFSATRASVRLLADSVLQRFFRRRAGATGWIGFRAAFPNGTGIISVSRAGLSQDGKWAVVHAGEQGDWPAGVGFLYVLHREGSGWRVRYKRVTWVS